MFTDTYRAQSTRSRAFNLWMEATGLTEAQLAEQTQRSVESVRSWRRGILPMPRERAWFEGAGFDWDAPCVDYLA